MEVADQINGGIEPQNVKSDLNLSTVEVDSWFFSR